MGEHYGVSFYMFQVSFERHHSLGKNPYGMMELKHGF